MKIYCNTENSLFSQKLEGEGIVQIDPACVIDINGVIIPGKDIKFSNLQLKQVTSVLPSINISEETVVKESQNPLVLNLNNLDSISASISKIKIEETKSLAPVEL